MSVTKAGDWRLPSPACFAVIGQSKAGKSTLIAKVIADASVWKRRPKMCLYSGPVVKRHSAYIRDLEKELIEQGMKFRYLDYFPDLKEIQAVAGALTPVILILDDVQVWEKHTNADVKVQKLLTAESHHENITVFFVIHNPYHPSFRDINLNCSGRFLMYQNSDWNKYQTMSGRMYGKGHGDFIKSCLLTGKEKYDTNYIFINSDAFSNFPTRYNCYSCMLTSEREKHGGNPVVFDLYNYERK